MQTLVDKYIMDTAGAMCSGFTTACNEMNRALCAMPVPKPLPRLVSLRFFVDVITLEGNSPWHDVKRL